MAGSSRAVLPKQHQKETHVERAAFVAWLVASHELGELTRSLSKNLFAFSDLRRFSSAKFLALG